MTEPFCRTFQRVARDLAAEREAFLTQLPHRVPVTDAELSRWQELTLAWCLLEELGCVYERYDREAVHA